MTSERSRFVVEAKNSNFPAAPSDLTSTDDGSVLRRSRSSDRLAATFTRADQRKTRVLAALRDIIRAGIMGLIKEGKWRGEPHPPESGRRRGGTSGPPNGRTNRGSIAFPAFKRKIALGVLGRALVIRDRPVATGCCPLYPHKRRESGRSRTSHL
jgi:hypothetical protein